MNGLLPLWRERGMISHDCVFKLRKILRTKKIEHGGALDPDVDGVLLIRTGKATEVTEYLTDFGRIYVGEITLGFSTTTEDRSGERVETKLVDMSLSEKEIDEVMALSIGEITQIPPMYPTVKVNGKRLYEYARSNEAVERPIRKVQIYRFVRTSELTRDEVTGITSQRFEVECGKGIYVRTLAIDTGRKLGYPTHMSDLTRTASAGMSQKDALTLEKVAQAVKNGTIDGCLLPIERRAEWFKRVDITDEVWQKVRNGVRLDYIVFTLPEIPLEEIALFYKGGVASTYQPNPKEKDKLKPNKILRNEEQQANTIKIRHPYRSEQVPEDDVVLVLGFSDGVYIGHQRVIKTGMEIAQREGLKLALMIFNQYPSIVFKKIDLSSVKYLTSLK